MIDRFPPLALAAALTVAAPFVSAQAPVVTFTTPAGYVKHDFGVGFNLVAIALHERAVFKGTIDSETGAEITDSDGNFNTVLTNPNATYLLEVTDVTSGQYGAVAEIVSWTATTVTLDGAIGAGVGAAYCIRPAKTLNNIFGTNLQGGSTDTSADTVWIRKSDGTYDRYFYSTIGSEFRSASAPFSAPSKPIPVFYPDGMFVQVLSTPKTITLFGDVKVIPTVVAANNGFNLVRVSSPAGQTLDESKLQDFLTAGSTDSSADTVWVKNGTGGYTRYFYSSFANEWKEASAPFGANAGATVLPSAVLIQRLGADTAGVFDLPDAFDNY